MTENKSANTLDIEEELINDELADTGNDKPKRRGRPPKAKQQESVYTDNPLYHSTATTFVDRDGQEKVLVRFHSTLVSWVYCPKCQKRLFQNNLLSGTLEHKCTRCGSIVVFVFGGG